MKLSHLVFLALQTGMHMVFVSSQPNVPSAADVAECGDLGVMTYNSTDLPDGVSPSAVRKCSNHPLALSITPAIAARDGDPASIIMGERVCWHGSPYGCTNKYCWKSCGTNGQWCWTAQSGGWGPWIGCNTYQDCNQDMACGQGGCAACGCSCLT